MTDSLQEDPELDTTYDEVWMPLPQKVVPAEGNPLYRKSSVTWNLDMQTSCSDRLLELAALDFQTSYISCQNT